MNAAKEIALLLISLTTIQLSQASNHSHHQGLLCARCDRVTDPLDCTYTTICENDEACHIAQFVTSQGNLFYKLGCKAKQECQALHVGRRQNGDTVFDERCCTKHPECNRDLFRKSKSLSCGSCKDIASPANCEKVVTCNSNEVCERTVYLSDEIRIRYTLQCVKKIYCGGNVLHRALFDDEDKDLCCDTNYCNMGENMKLTTVTTGPTNTATSTTAARATTAATTDTLSTTTRSTTPSTTPTTTDATTSTPTTITTTPAITTTTTPSTTTTTSTTATTQKPTTPSTTTTPTNTPTTTTTTTPSTTSTTTTTTTPSTTFTITTATTPTTIIATTTTTTTTTPTTLPPGVLCQSCTSFLCLVTHNFQMCEYPMRYCYTNIKVSSNGHVELTKKCASKQTCQKLWWQQSSDREECVNLKQHLQDHVDFTCDYCCTTDKCNADDVPATNTLFKGSD